MTCGGSKSKRSFLTLIDLSSLLGTALAGESCNLQARSSEEACLWVPTVAARRGHSKQSSMDPVATTQLVTDVKSM